VLMGLEQPAYSGKKGWWNRLGVDLVGAVPHFLVQAVVEICWRGIKPMQDTDVHGLIDLSRVKALEVLADGSV